VGRVLRFTLIGCGGLIALVVLLGVVGALVGGGGGGTAGNDGDDAPDTPVEKQEEQAGLDKLEEDAQNQQNQQEQQEQDQAQKEIEELERQLEQAEQQQAQEEEQAPPPEEDDGGEGVVFRVTGDPGQRFQGSLALTDTQRSIQGVTPKSYPLRGIDTGMFSSDIVSGNAQKMQAGDGTLTVQIIVDGEVVKKASTSAEYGVAQVAWMANE
jgi:TolA-binding protein